MNKKIQSWSTVRNGISTPYTGAVKTFAEYQAEIRTEKLVNKAYTDHLLQQLAVAQQAPVAVDQVKSNAEILEQIESLKMSLKPVATFLDNISKPVIKNTKAPTKLERLAKQKEKIRLSALAKFKQNGG